MLIKDCFQEGSVLPFGNMCSWASYVISMNINHQQAWIRCEARSMDDSVSFNFSFHSECLGLLFLSSSSCFSPPALLFSSPPTLLLHFLIGPIYGPATWECKTACLHQRCDGGRSTFSPGNPILADYCLPGMVLLLLLTCRVQLLWKASVLEWKTVEKWDNVLMSGWLFY